MIRKIIFKSQSILDTTRAVDFLAPCALRFYLAFIFFEAGINKWSHIDSTIAWFGNSDWGLGLPYPTLLGYMATYTELIGAVCLAIGFAVRWVSIPLMTTMLVAIFSVHWMNGWLAIAPSSSQAATRLQNFLDWLEKEDPGRHMYITELGKPVVLNNGIEFAVTYFIMLLTLFFFGAGKYVSLDYWIRRKFMDNTH